MFRKGTPVVVSDELRDEYIALLAHDTKDLHKINPYVKVLFMLSYPIQHAILFPDIVSENAPVPEGVVCRLRFRRFPAPEEMSRFSSYQESVEIALHDAMTHAVASGDNILVSILERHTKGDIRAKRVLCIERRF